MLYFEIWQIVGGFAQSTEERTILLDKTGRIYCPLGVKKAEL